MARPKNTRMVDRARNKMDEQALARRMYEMRVKGKTLAFIAEVFNVSVSYVHTILEKYARAELVPFVEEYRQLQLQRIEYMWDKLVASGRLEKGEPAAIMAGNALLKRMADQLGTDAPTKLELEHKIDPREIELRERILAARARANAEIREIKGSDPEPDEDDDGDIQEAEIVEEDDE